MKPHSAEYYLRAEGGGRDLAGRWLRLRAVATALLSKSDIAVRFLFQRGESAPEPIEEEWIRRFDGPLREAVPDSATLLLDSGEADEQKLRMLSRNGVKVALLDDRCRLSHYPVRLVIVPTVAALDQPWHGEADTVFLLGPSYHPLILPPGTDEPGPLPEMAPLLFDLRGFTGAEASSLLTAWPDIPAEEVTVYTHEDPDLVFLPEHCLRVGDVGHTALVAAALGHPQLLVPRDERQDALLSELENAKAAVRLADRPGEVDGEWLRAALYEIRPDQALRAMLGRNARALIDGHGADRIAEEIQLLHTR